MQLRCFHFRLRASFCLIWRILPRRMTTTDGLRRVTSLVAVASSTASSGCDDGQGRLKTFEDLRRQLWEGERGVPIRPQLDVHATIMGYSITGYAVKDDCVSASRAEHRGIRRNLEGYNERLFQADLLRYLFARCPYRP